MHRTFYHADGSVAVMHFATDDPKLIDRDTLAHLARNPGATWEQDTALPANRRFRNCWTRGGLLGVVVDITKARLQVLAEIRAERDKRLAATDGDYMRAQEQNKPAEVAALATKRQALRDIPATITPAINALASPEALDAYVVNWPA